MVGKGGRATEDNSIRAPLGCVLAPRRVWGKFPIYVFRGLCVFSPPIRAPECLPGISKASEVASRPIPDPWDRLFVFQTSRF